MQQKFEFSNVLEYWFLSINPEFWWKKDDAFDRELAQQFEKILIAASKGELFYWRNSAAGRLAEIIVLDQFSRNIYRNTPQAFAQDGMALVLAQEAVAQGALQDLKEDGERVFLLMPYMHSESASIHDMAEYLFHENTPAQNYQFELQHKVIIDRFGRYPHRNAILNRQSSSDELEFLAQPGSSF